MARPLRLEFPGSLWHVTTRGNERRSIFGDDDDRRHYIELLGRCVRRFQWILHAYSLMPNHVHLVVQLLEETLSRGMQWLNGTYSQAFNRRHERVGHLVQGRFGAFLVEGETYGLEVLRYVVLNPVRAGLVANPEEYEWSSHRAVLGLTEAPDWLAVDDVLAQFGSERTVARERYRAFVNDPVGQDHKPWKDLVGQMFLGSDNWIQSVRERIELKPRADDHPRAQRMAGRPAMADVLSAVADTLSLTTDDVRIGRRVRLIAAWIASNEVLLTNSEIAAGLRLRSSGYVSELLREADQEVGDDSTLRACIDECVSTLRGPHRETKA